MLRLVQLDDFRLEAYLDGVLMVFTHKDVPGIIGTVGTIFGKHQINIAQMAVGRASQGGRSDRRAEPRSGAHRRRHSTKCSAHPAIQSRRGRQVAAGRRAPTWLAGRAPRAAPVRRTSPRRRHGGIAAAIAASAATRSPSG